MRSSSSFENYLATVTKKPEKGVMNKKAKADAARLRAKMFPVQHPHPDKHDSSDEYDSSDDLGSLRPCSFKRNC